MPQYYGMPKLSDTMTEGTVANWLVKEGDEVSAGTELAEIETDKATMAMESYHDGVIHKIYVQAGGKAPLGAPLALLLEDGEEPPADADNPPANVDESIATPEPAAAAPAASGSAAPAKKASASATPAVTADGHKVKISPLAKRIAEEKGINYAGPSAVIFSR